MEAVWILHLPDFKSQAHTKKIPPAIQRERTGLNLDCIPASSYTAPLISNTFTSGGLEAWNALCLRADSAWHKEANCLAPGPQAPSLLPIAPRRAHSPSLSPYRRAWGSYRRARRHTWGASMKAGRAGWVDWRATMEAWRGTLETRRSDCRGNSGEGNNRGSCGCASPAGLTWEGAAFPPLCLSHCKR